MIYIEPRGGLANRMRALASAISIAKELNRKLTCIWLENSELNASFESLFKKIEYVEFLNSKKKYKNLKFSDQQKAYKKAIVKIINKFWGIDYNVKEKDFSEFDINERHEFIKSKIIKNDRIYINTCEQFCNIGNVLNFFQPTEEINLLISSITKKFDSNTIGIHIRRTDNYLSIQNSPTSLFIEKINSILTKNPNTNFFLSTDDKSVEHNLIELFGDKIITFEKNLNRNTTIGIKHAVVDMFCLSKCSLIYGSYWSSFSLMAGDLTQIRLKILTNK